MQYFSSDPRSAYEAKCEAQRLAFAPVAFQACRVLRDTGLLAAVQASRPGGLSLEEGVTRTGLPRYGAKVLLEAGLGIGVVTLQEERYHLTKLGYFILNDAMTRANMDCVHDICYRGIFHLEEAIRTGAPAGLATLGPWPTLYEGLSSLSPEARRSWLAWDHYYSDAAFPGALPHVFSTPPRQLLDVGGNTGKWARLCTAYHPQVQVTIADLPQQLDLARANLAGHPALDRVQFHPLDVLDASRPLPGGHDVIWMSQFLDCFSEEEIVSILRRTAAAMGPGTRLFILELFWDRQPNETAAFCLQQTSLYFACLANGRSQMYRAADFLRCIEQSGLEAVSQRDQIGFYHTLLECRRNG